MIPPALQPLWDDFTRLFAKEDHVYKRNLKSVETKFIQEADLQRDNALMMLRRGIDFAFYNAKLPIKQAAMTLMEVMDNYKDVGRKSFGENTALIINMLQDLKKPRYAGAISFLGLTEAVNCLEENNTAFKELYTERTLNINEQKKQGCMVDIRPRVDQAFFRFTDALDALYKINELTDKDASLRADLDEIIDLINSYIKQYERILARRNLRHKPGKTDRDKPDDTTIADSFYL
jgi:hypothetical protein